MTLINSIYGKLTLNPSKGDIIYYNGTTWVNLSPGTSGYVLKTQGSGADPIWDAGSNVNLTGAITSVGAATSLGSFSSANLASALTDETGSGAAVFANSPTLVTPALGTPSSGTLTNCTGLPEGGLSLTDITTNNVSTSKHGFAPKLPNDATKYLDGTGSYSVPSSSSSLPVATLIFCADSSMSGFLLCDGTAVSRTTYSALFGVIGTSFGVGDGSTTFNLPDMRSSVPGAIGQRSGLTNRTLGTFVGEESHTMTTSELVSHGHSILAQYNGGGTSGGTTKVSSLGNTPDGGTQVTATTAVQNTGSSTPFNVMQPTLFVGRCFIKY